MVIERVRLVDGKRFFWDGREYESDEAADSIEREYLERGFEVQRLSDEGRALLYSRRSVSPAKDSDPEGGGAGQRE